MRRAVRLQSVGGCRLVAVNPRHVSWLAYRPESSSPPYTHTPQLRQGPADGTGTTARVVTLTLKPPPAGMTHWSTRDLADTIGGISHTTVHRIWRAHALQPHRVETFNHSTDP